MQAEMLFVVHVVPPANLFKLAQINVGRCSEGQMKFATLRE